MEDKYGEILRKRVEDMNTRDKAGLSFVDIFKPYSDLYNYVMMKIGLMTGAEKEKHLKALGMMSEKLNQKDYE